MIQDGNVIVIKYKTERNKDYYDIPGGKTETNETSIDASIRDLRKKQESIF